MSQQGIFFAGKQILIPGAYAAYQSLTAAPIQAAAANVVALLGTSTGGMPFTPTGITGGNMDVAQQLFTSGPLVDAAELATYPLGRGIDNNPNPGATEFLLVRVTNALQATNVIKNVGAVTVGTETSLDYGVKTNNIQTTYAAGTLANTTIVTIQDPTQTPARIEVSPALGQVLNIGYTGNGTATYQVTPTGLTVTVTPAATNPDASASFTVSWGGAIQKASDVAKYIASQTGFTCAVLGSGPMSPTWFDQMGAAVALNNTTWFPSAPVAPAVSTATTGGTIAAGVYQVSYTWVGPWGESLHSTEAPITTTGATSTITVTPGVLPAGAYGFRIYLTAPAGAVGTETWAATVTTTGATSATLTAPAPASGGLAPATNVYASPLTAPATSTATSGGTVAAGTYLCCYTYQTATGETTRSPEATQVTTGATSTLTVTPGALPAGATNVRVYVTAVGGATGTETLQGSYNGVGTNLILTAPPVVGAVLPTTNTATIPQGTGTVATATIGAVVDWVNRNSGMINITLPATPIFTSLLGARGQQNLTGGSDGTETAANWQKAFNSLIGQPCYFVVPVYTNSDPNLEAQVRAMAIAHVMAQRDITVRKRRVTYLGHQWGIMTPDPVTGLINTAPLSSLMNNMNNSNVVQATPGFQRALFGRAVVTNYSAYYLAAIAAGIKAGSQPQVPLTLRNFACTALELNYDPAAQIALIKMGASYAAKATGQVYPFRFQIGQTTWIQDADNVLSEPSMIHVGDVLSTTSEQVLEAKYGGKAFGGPGMLENFKSDFRAVLEAAKQLGMIVDGIDPVSGQVVKAYRNLRVGFQNKTWSAYAEVTGAAPGNYITVQFGFGQASPTNVS